VKTALLIILCLAVIVAGAVGVNKLAQQSAGVPKERVTKAERYLRARGKAYTLRECQIPLNEDPSTIHCYGKPAGGGRDVYLRIDFTADDVVSGVCVVGSRGCS
jgi:hypothetical protein